MKKLILMSLLFIACAFGSKSQTANDLSERISSKMADSLGLNSAQKKRILDINYQLQNSKSEVRRNYENPDSISKYTQRIENKRDSLYRGVLTDDKYKLYLQKKKTLVSL